MVLPKSFVRRVAALLLAMAAPALHAQDAERLRIHGSATLGTRIVPAIVADWLRDSGYRDVRQRSAVAGRIEISAQRDGERVVVEIDNTGSDAGFADLVDQNAEIAMATRPPTAEEREAAWQLGDLDAADQAFTVAVGGLQFAVDARSPVIALSVRQLRDIYSGRVQRWSEVGGPARDIHPVWSGPATASGGMLVSDVMGGATVHARQLPLDISLPDADQIRAYPLSVRLPRGLRALAVSDGGIAVRPDRAGTLSEDYPLARRYTLYGGPVMSALGRSLAMYAIGLQGQRAVERAGGIPVMLRPVRGATPATVELADGSLSGATRLPLSIRFDPDGLESILDARAVRDLDRVEALMRSPAMRGRALAVVAFVDAQREGRLVAEQFSNDRADYIATLLAQRGVTVWHVRGLADTARLATGPDARHRNERVELWLR